MAPKPPRRSPPKPPASEPAQEDTSVHIGDVLDGKYRLVQRLDEGGMGSVFIGHNEALDVPVAVKVIRSDVRGGSKEKLGERLLQEARAAARLGHPAIVRMMDFGTAPGGDPYLVMELLDGEDLATALDQRGRVNPAKAVRILMPIVHALATAHDKGIVHRDLKPDNIILAQTEGGQVQPKLIDFGIAKLHGRSKKRLTVVGDSLGTPEYMSPQQARGEDVDASADIWAMSVLLYEMVTGRLPFDGGNYHALLRAIIEDDPEPIRNLGVQAEELWAVLRRGMAKRPEDRWPSMRDFGRGLAAWLLSQGVSEDICGASLRANWLAQSTESPADILGSIPPPPDEATLVRAPVVEIFADESPPPSSDVAAAATEPDSEAAGVADEPPVSEPGVAPAGDVEDTSTDDVVIKSPPLAQYGTRQGRPLTFYGLALLVLGGVVWAVTGYLGIALPGIPARWGATVAPTPTATRAAPPPSDTATPVAATSEPSSLAAADAGSDAGDAGADDDEEDAGAPDAAADAAASPPRRPYRRPARSDRYLPSEL